jgi:hypothetical protein
MKQYQIINSYSIATGQQAETCEHCGRAIKHVTVVHDNVNNTDIKIGCTCIIKVMKLNENFNKALVKAIKSYNKEIDLKKKYLDYIIENVKADYFESLENDGLNQWNDREGRHGFTKAQLYYSWAINVWYSLHDILRYTEKLNEVSKTGLVEIDTEELKQKIKFWDNYLDEIKVNKYYPEI